MRVPASLHPDVDDYRGPITDRRRAYQFARPGDTLQSIAARLMPEEPDAERLLASWNLHLAYRRQPTERPGELLGTDVVYTEAPLP